MRAVSRQASLVCAGVLVALGLAVTASAASSGDPKHAFNPQDTGWAKRIALGRADLPTGVKWNWTAIGGSGGSGGSGADAGCPGVHTDESDLTETGGAASVAVSTNHQYIIAALIWVFKRPSQAAAFVQRLVAGMGRCGPALAKSALGQSKTARLVSYGPHTIPGTPGFQNFRLVASVANVQGTRIKSFVDFGFGHLGRATMAVILHGAYEQIPAPVEADLVRLMMNRMAHPPH